LLLRAVLDGMAVGVAAAAHLRVAAVLAPAAGGLVEVKAHCLWTTLFSRSILSSIFRSTGLERPKGDARPEAARFWLDGVGLKALFVRTACRAL